MHLHDPNDVAAARLDRATLRKVTALAARLQSQHRETVTVAEVERIGAEVGLEPAFIRQAVALVAAESAAGAAEAPVVPGEHSLVRARRREFGALIGSLSLPVLWGAIAYLVRPELQSWTQEWMAFATLLAPVPLAVLQGFIAGRKAPAFTAGAWLAFCLSPTFWQFVYHGSSFTEFFAWLAALTYVTAGGMTAGLLGCLGARARDYYFPPLSAALPKQTPEPAVSRPALLQLLHALPEEASEESR
jgi:hypothetical protein